MQIREAFPPHGSLKVLPLNGGLAGAIVALLLLTALGATAAFAAEAAPPVVYLWPSGAPTLQGTNEKEITVPPDAQPGQRINSIRNVHNPLIEVHLPPPEKATG